MTGGEVNCIRKTMYNWKRGKLYQENSAQREKVNDTKKTLKD